MPKKYSLRKIKRQEDAMWKERENELGKRPYNHSKNYTRREFLKSGARVGGSAAVYGAVGGFLGKGYETIRDAFYGMTQKTGNKLGELDKKVEEMGKYNPAKVAKKVEETRGSFWRKIFGRTEEDQAKWRDKYGIKNPREDYEAPKDSNEPNQPYKSQTKQEEISRRGFLKTILGYAQRHPVGAGIAAGAAYGAGKSAYRQHGSVKDKIEIARLKGRVDYLEERTNPAESGRIKESGLEKTFTIIGIIGLIISIFFSLSNITGLAVLSMGAQKTQISSIIILIISFMLIIVGKIKFKN